MNPTGGLRRSSSRSVGRKSAQLVVDPKLGAADVRVRHQALFRDLIERNAINEARAHGNAFLSRGGFGSRARVPSAGDESLEPLVRLKQHHQTVTLTTDAEPDACQAHPHVGALTGRLVDCDAVAAATRNDEATFSDCEHRITRSATVKTPSVFLFEQLIERGLCIAIDLLLAFLDLRVALSEHLS